jgi:hypothetical protein
MVESKGEKTLLASEVKFRIVDQLKNFEVI